MGRHTHDVGTPGRLAWVDATRGYAVAAVVLFHVTLWHVISLDGLQPDGRAAWIEVNTVLDGARMPTLLVVSGLVLARQVRQGLHRSTTVLRAATSYYLYVVWLAVYAVFYAVVGSRPLPHRVDGAEVVGQLLVPDTTLWFVFALAVYVPVLAMARRVPPWVVLVLLVGLTVAVRQDGVPPLLWRKVPEYFVFFAAGVYAAPAVRRLARSAGALPLLAAIAVAAAVGHYERLLDGTLSGPLMFVARNAVFVVVAVLAVALLARWAPARVLGGLLGRHALAIYVLHPLLVTVLMILDDGPLAVWMASVVATPSGSLAYPLVASAAIIVLAIVLQSAAERLGLRFLFGMPARLRGAIAGTERSRAGTEPVRR